MPIKKPILPYRKDGHFAVLPPYFAFSSRKKPHEVRGLLRNNGRTRRSLMIRGIFGAKLQGHLQRLLLRLFSACRGSLWHSVAAYSPFHCSCSNKFHSTIFPSFLSMDTSEREGKIPRCRFCMISYCFSGIFVTSCQIAFCVQRGLPYFRFSGFRHSSSGRINLPSLRISTSSNQISPPPYSGVIISTKSQWIADLLPLGASS